MLPNLVYVSSLILGNARAGHYGVTLCCPQDESQGAMTHLITSTTQQLSVAFTQQQEVRLFKLRKTQENHIGIESATLKLFFVCVLFASMMQSVWHQPYEKNPIDYT